MENFRQKAKTAADRLAQVVENNPSIKKAADYLKSVPKNIAENLSEATARQDDKSPEAERPTLIDRAKMLFAKLPPVPIEVSEFRLNQLAANAIADAPRIKSLTIQCTQDRLTISGTLSLIGLPLNFTTQLSLRSCELNPTRKLLTLRRHDNIALGGESVLSSFMAHIVKIVVCGLFGVDLAAISLKDIKGLTINKDLITADLEAMGAVDAIMTGLREKILQGFELLPASSLVKMGIKPVLEMAGPMLLGRILLQNVAFTDSGIRGEIVL